MHDLEELPGLRTLVVPSIKAGEQMDFRQFWQAYEDIVRRARRNELTMEDYAGTTISLGPINSLGRNVNNTIYVEDDFVSANHAMLTFRGRGWFVEDQGSTNGTYVNGHRIDRPVALSYGDELTIGRVRMRLER